MSSMSELRERARVRVGTTIREKWTVDALLGVGGTAAVYAATHRNGKRAALKVLHAELTGSRELVTRFVREGYVANRLEHPGVCSVLDDDTTEDGSPFLVMDLLLGHSLERHTRAQYILTVPEVVDIGEQLLDVLALAHARGILHRDIKPANLFLTDEGRLKVLDFGIARIAEPLDGAVTQAGTAIGTPAYMPPEQARGRWKVVDARTDVWAAGATMFALLAGRKPRRAETVQEELYLAMTEPVPSLATEAPHVPGAIVSVVDCAMAFEMDQRFPAADVMKAALRQAAAAAGVLGPMSSGSAPHSVRSPGIRNPSSVSGPRLGVSGPPVDPGTMTPSVSSVLPPPTGQRVSASPPSLRSTGAAPRSGRGAFYAAVALLLLASIGMFFVGRRYFGAQVPAAAASLSGAGPQTGVPVAMPLPATSALTTASSAEPSATGSTVPRRGGAPGGMVYPVPRATNAPAGSIYRER
ncbi:MAG: protein kinase [Polyangiaceae bacterium]|nr:protein kinase [Polyangiaceae bacterium]